MSTDRKSWVYGRHHADSRRPPCAARAARTGMGERLLLESLLHMSMATCSRWQRRTKLYGSTGVRIDSILSLVAMAKLPLSGTRAGEDANKTRRGAQVKSCSGRKFRKIF